jgi:hypothetical protein
VRRRLITLLVAGLVLLAGFAAAAVASGGSPLGLLRDKPATPVAHQRHAKVVAARGNAPSARPKDASADDSGSTEKPDRDEDQGAPEQRSGSAEAGVEHKVTVCHHTGSWKHPFHAISVDENAVAAHRDHGDTIGPCPAATHVAPSANAAKHGSHPGKSGRGESDEHGRGHDNGRRSKGGGDGRSQSR